MQDTPRLGGFGLDSVEAAILVELPLSPPPS